jgi:hypothetical protein
MQKVFEERFQASRAPDALLDFLNLSIRQLFPPGANRSIVPQAIKKQFDLTQSKAHITREADQERSVERIVRIVPLATGAVWSSEQAKSFVVADRGSIQANATGEFSNLHFLAPPTPLHKVP